LSYVDIRLQLSEKLPNNSKLARTLR